MAEVETLSPALEDRLTAVGRADVVIVMPALATAGALREAAGRARQAVAGLTTHVRTVVVHPEGLLPDAEPGETDDLGYNVVSGGVHIHDLQATILHCLGIDHRRLTYKFQGRRYRLTDVHGNVVREVVA